MSTVSRVKQHLIQRPDANAMNQHNKYSDKYNYCECFTHMLLEKQNSQVFFLKAGELCYLK